MTDTTAHPIICIHDDRPTHLVGIKLAVLSIRHHSPELPIVVSYPNPPATFRAWIDKQQNVKLVSFPEFKELGWNVKPGILMRLFESGYSEIIWVDSDIIANGNILSSLSTYSPETLVVAQETYWGHKQGGDFRTRAWKLKPGRSLPYTMNGGLFRVTRYHLPLLKAWQDLMKHPAYIKIQSMQWYERPIHMLGDQDVLTALMGSAEFADIPFVLLRRGVDIVQCFGPSGYTPGERLRNLFKGLPPLVHAMDLKPWTKPNEPPKLFGTGESFKSNLREYLDYLSLEFSPYTFVSHRYRDAIEEDPSWMDIKSSIGKLMNFLTGGNPTMIGFPLSVFETIIRAIRRALKVTKYTASRETETNNPL